MTKQISSSSSSASLNTSPARAKLVDADANLNHVFSSSNSFFNHDHTSKNRSQTDSEIISPRLLSEHRSRIPPNPWRRVYFVLGDPSKQASADRPVSSSTSSSSSIDEALIHLTRQQSSKLPTLSKLFNDEPSSIFHFPTSRAPANDHRQDEQQRAVHDNIQFLASMTTASTAVAAEPSWPAAARQSSHQPPPRMMQPAVNNLSTFIQEFMDKLNELCYRGFDELNTLIQEQRWVCTLNFLILFRSRHISI